jgi:hypothetical protein
MGSTAGLVEPFKTNVDRLVAASHGAVSVTSGFRTRAQQVEARKRNGCPDIYKSPASACRVPTAIPGTSQHERGLAVDFGGDLALADRLAPQFGMHRTVPGEAWHFEPTNASAMTPADPQSGNGIVDTITGVGGDLVGAAVNPFLDGIKRLLITGLIVAGAAGLVAAGAYRSVTGKSLTKTAASTAGSAVTTAAVGATTGGTGVAAKTAGTAKKATRPRSAP